MAKGFHSMCSYWNIHPASQIANLDFCPAHRIFGGWTPASLRLTRTQISREQAGMQPQLDATRVLCNRFSKRRNATKDSFSLSIQTSFFELKHARVTHAWNRSQIEMIFLLSPQDWLENSRQTKFVTRILRESCAPSIFYQRADDGRFWYSHVILPCFEVNI